MTEKLFSERANKLYDTAQAEFEVLEKEYLDGIEIFAIGDTIEKPGTFYTAGYSIVIEKIERRYSDDLEEYVASRISPYYRYYGKLLQDSADLLDTNMRAMIPSTVAVLVRKGAKNV